MVANFLKSVSLFPEKNALFINSSFYTYKQFFNLVVQVYNQLPKDKIYDKIGVYCNDTVYDYAAIMAVNLYGAAYVPLNPKFPVEKNRTIVKQSDVNLILVAVELNNDISKDVQVIHINEKSNDIQSIKGLDEFRKLIQPFAYILFTSGSTGEPKGVPVSFENCNTFFDFFYKYYSFTSEDRFLQVYELTFDVSVFSFFMPLQVGACCYVVPNNSIKFMKTAEMLLAHSITVVSMVPSTLWYLKKYFSEIQLPFLKYSFFSGDVLNFTIAMEWKSCLPNAQIHNFYGPTETTIVCTHYVFDKEITKEESMNDIVPIGKPFSGMEYVIIDELNNEVEKGELCFFGKQVISGYLNNTNAEKFISINGKTYYKTGDRACVNANGDLLFEGRIDSQVKINGYRVELGEVEYCLEKIVMSKCVVNVKRNADGLNELVAFVSSNTFSEKEIKQKLSLLLPEYMIPAKIIFVESLPLTINGKVDKTKLLELI